MLAYGASPDEVRAKAEALALRVLAREGYPDVVFAFHDGDEIGPRA